MHVATDIAVTEYIHRMIFRPSETIAWQGRPAPSKAAAVGLYHGIFGIICVGISILIAVNESGHATLIGLPFIGAGLWLMSQPARNYFRARRTYYAITNQRILVITMGETKRLTVIRPGKFEFYNRQIDATGRGTIRFKELASGSTSWSGARMQISVRISSDFSDGLWGIADARGAIDAIERMQSAM